MLLEVHETASGGRDDGEKNQRRGVSMEVRLKNKIRGGEEVERVHSMQKH